MSKNIKQNLFLLVALVLVAVTYSTHLSLNLIPKGYDLLFHLGNVFALQIKLGFIHNSWAFFGISPLIFNDYGYGTHLFYPPLAHFIPSLISFFLSKVGINSTLLAIRIFSFLTIFGSGLSMFYVANKITNHRLYAIFAGLLYLSVPYLQMDYYWRGGMTSSLSFVFLPILLLSLYYFIKEKYRSYLITFVISMSLIIWTHLITAFFSLMIFLSAIIINFFFVKKKVPAISTTVVAGLMIFLISSPFLILLAQQYWLDTHVLFSSAYPFNITDVAYTTIGFWSLFDIQFAVWEFKIRNLTAIFNLVTLPFTLAFILLIRKIVAQNKELKTFIYSLIGISILLIIMITTKSFWLYLPDFISFIQFPHRLLLLLAPILSLLMALPLLLVRTHSSKIFITLSAMAFYIVSYTFVFNNYELYELGTIDFTTHSILQAVGVEQEYLPNKTKDNLDYFTERQFAILPLTAIDSKNITEVFLTTPSATIVTNQTPYLLAEITNNESKKTVFELPRLFYSGYELIWTTDNSDAKAKLSYFQSDKGLIVTSITGNGTLEVQYTGGQWYLLTVISSGLAIILLIIISQNKLKLD